jgi:hypothetical protein
MWIPTGSRKDLRELNELISETAEIIATFLERDGGQVFQEAKECALEALKNTRNDNPHTSETHTDRKFRWRLEAQTEYLRKSGRDRPAPRGILYDADNELAFGYFSIDRAMLTKEIGGDPLTSAVPSAVRHHGRAVVRVLVDRLIDEQCAARPRV